MDLKSIQSEFLKVYADAVARFRWLLLTTTLLSGLMLTHLYLEHSLSNQQLKQSLLKQIVSGVSRQMKERKKRIEAWQGSMEQFELQKKELDLMRQSKAQSTEWVIHHSQAETYGAIAKAKKGDSAMLSAADFDRESRKYADQVYQEAQYKNDLNRLHVEDRTIPLLSLTVPGNDFVHVLACLLFLLLTFMWITARSIRAPLTSLLDCSPGHDNTSPDADETLRLKTLKELLRLQFLFTGSVDTNGRDPVARWLRRIFPFLPVSLATIAFLIEERNLRTDALFPSLAGDEMQIFNIRSGVLLTLLIAEFVLSYLIHKNLEEVQGMVRPEAPG